MLRCINSAQNNAISSLKGVLYAQQRNFKTTSESRQDQCCIKKHS